jgi:thioredoxin reductase (NADPH)
MSEKKNHKLIIIGGGPSAHTAAIYAARAGLSPVLFEGALDCEIIPGGQLVTTTDVENFPGFPDGINGADLVDLLKKQAIKFGTDVVSESVCSVDFSTRPFALSIKSDNWNESDGSDQSTKKYYANSIIIATGATAKRLGINGENLFWNHGISACAVCDGALPMFRKKELIVVGGGDTACEEALFLTRFASRVYLLVRSNKIRASKIMQDRVTGNSKIQIIWNSLPVEALGSDPQFSNNTESNNTESDDNRFLSHVKIQNTLTSEVSYLKVAGMFYAIGHKPNTDLFVDQLILDETGYIKCTPGSTETNIEGVFAAGDVQDKKYRQAITACGTGCMAALDAERWLETNCADECFEE